jgi:glycosyltransferase involved in cell wall biosynthesis
VHLTSVQPKQNLRVLALAPYPALAAATRYRLSQLREPLVSHGIQLDIRPFLSDDEMTHLYDRGVARKAAGVSRGLGRRVRDLYDWRRFDVVLVQREAMLIGPPIVEWLLTSIASRPLVLDIDDPVWLPEQSQVPSALSRLRRWPGKTDWLLSHAALVTCGSGALATYVVSLGLRARLVPNGIDVALLHPAMQRERTGGLPTVGWIGTHTTYPYLESVFPALEAAGRRFPFRLLIVGSGRTSASVAGVPTEVRPFALERETEDFATLDVGLYPLADDQWARGKSGLKALQYLAVGVPYIASPVGVVAEIGIPGTTHLEATTNEQWENALTCLLRDPELRATMGASGRRYAESNYTVEQSATAMASALMEAANT